jgi:hypothetical protein
MTPDLFSNNFLDVLDQPELMKRRKDQANHSNKNKKVFIIGHKRSRKCYWLRLLL